MRKREETGMKSTYKTVIVGAGPAGLSTAYHLDDQDYLLLEREDRVGGLCKSDTISSSKGDFIFDRAGHIMFTKSQYIKDLWVKLLGTNMLWQDREAWIYSHDVYTRYPFQGALYGLPADVIKECLTGLIEATYGYLAGSTSADSTPDQTQTPGMNSSNGNGMPKQNLQPKNFEEWIYAAWGSGISKHFMIPYNKKIWMVPLSVMTADWIGGRVPQPNISEIIEGALRPQPKPMGPNAKFGYPLYGGFEAIMKGFLPLLSGKVHTRSEVTAIDPKRRSATWTNHATGESQEVGYEALMIAMPLPDLVEFVDGVPDHVRQAGRNLLFNPIYCVNLGVDRPNVTEKHWVYYPEDTVFHRIFVQSNASPHLQPAGTSSLVCEISYHDTYKPISRDGLIERAIEDCKKVKMITPDDQVLCTDLVDLKYAYVVYDHDRKKNVGIIHEWMRDHGIHCVGRFGEWEYYNHDQAILSGRRAADVLNRLRSGTPMQQALQLAVAMMR